CLRCVQRAYRRAECARIDPMPRCLNSGEMAGPVERPRKVVAGPSDEDGRGNADGQPLREHRQHSDLPLGTWHHDLAPREPEGPLAIDPEDGVVPALADQLDLVGPDLLKSGANEPARPLLVDVLFGGPDLRHARARRP